ncbi:MAG: FAD-dependent oxidoreductase, partial [Nocardioidaceae bacterium]|nr:FAD-dependent oxidoreductase [Nocardioidaceae bacterium]MDF2968861.1 FAD-dependent oxidoreductase [Nocardioidaceae bacterium]
EKYVIDLDYCKGCGLCVAECPSGAIEMVPEDI